MPRPFEKLPPGASAYLYSVAAAGNGLTESKASTGLGIPLDQFKKILRDHPPSKRLWDSAMAVERESLFQRMFEASAAGDLKATQFLLAARHGVTEKTEAAQAPVNISLRLPGSFPMEQWEKVIHQPHQDSPPRQLEEIPK